MKSFLNHSLLLTGLGMCLAWVACQSPSQSPPNIILLYVDDLGWRDPGFMGNRFHETPHIDQLAAESMVFTQAYANAPNCAPSRASLLTGRYNYRTRVVDTWVGRSMMEPSEVA